MRWPRPRPRRDYGWACREGLSPSRDLHGRRLHPTRSSTTTRAGTHAVTGGYLVRDPGLPTLIGRYLYADSYDGGPLLLARLAGDDGRRAAALPRAQHLVSFGEDACGHVYVVSIDRGSVSGSRTARRAPACSSRRRRRCPRWPPGGGAVAGRVRPHRPARADPGRGQGPRRPPREAADRAHRERGLPRHDPRPPRRLDARPRPHLAPRAAAARSSASARRRRRSSASAARSAATSASRCACRSPRSTRPATPAAPRGG